MVAVGVTLIVAGMADRLLGPMLLNESADLVFPAYSIARHRSIEFDLSVRINNLGFRGPHTTLAKQRKRVLVIGDSFTFGWGVRDHETWVQLLQDSLPDWEVLNLGQGGTHPGDHIRLMRTVVPILRPDIVIQGVLQANDMNQLLGEIAHESGIRLSPTAPSLASMKVQKDEWDREPWTARALARLFPNLNRRFGRNADISNRCRAEATALRRSFNDSLMARYMNLDPEVRGALEEGRLNPWVVFESMYYPRAFHTSADTTMPLLRDAMVRLSHYLIQMRDICTSNGAGLIVVSLPNRPYGCPECLKDLARLGYDTAGCDTLDGDAAIRWAITAADVTTIPACPPMGRECFFPLDGHWNAEGHRRFAKALIRMAESGFKDE